MTEPSAAALSSRRILRLFRARRRGQRDQNHAAKGPDMSNGHHNLRPVDPHALERWREDTAQREEEFARERSREERERQRAAEAVAATECTRLRAEPANLRVELDQRRQAEFEAIAEVAVDHSNTILRGWAGGGELSPLGRRSVES
jgi:hypothetical protein